MSSALQVHGLPGKRRAYTAKQSSAPRLSMIRVGNVVTVTALTAIVGSPVYYHWYLDGMHVGSGTSPNFSFSMEQAGQGRLDVVDTLDPNFDPLSATVAQFPARYTVHWVRSLDADTREYSVTQDDGGGFAEIARIPATEAWDYILVSDRLVDGSIYEWKVTPSDAAGNPQNTGTVVTTGGRRVLRTPDSPAWNYTYDPGTDRVNFAAA